MAHPPRLLRGEFCGAFEKGALCRGQEGMAGSGVMQLAQALGKRHFSPTGTGQAPGSLVIGHETVSRGAGKQGWTSGLCLSCCPALSLAPSPFPADLLTLFLEVKQRGGGVRRGHTPDLCVSLDSSKGGGASYCWKELGWGPEGQRSSGWEISRTLINV